MQARPRLCVSDAGDLGVNEQPEQSSKLSDVYIKGKNSETKVWCMAETPLSPLQS